MILKCLSSIWNRKIKSSRSSSKLKRLHISYSIKKPSELNDLKDKQNLTQSYFLTAIVNIKNFQGIVDNSNKV